MTQTAHTPHLDCAASEALSGEICAAAGLAAQSECQLLELIGEFDAGNAVRWWTAEGLINFLAQHAERFDRHEAVQALFRMPVSRAA